MDEQRNKDVSCFFTKAGQDSRYKSRPSFWEGGRWGQHSLILDPVFQNERAPILEPFGVRDKTGISQLVRRAGGLWRG